MKEKTKRKIRYASLRRKLLTVVLALALLLNGLPVVGAAYAAEGSELLTPPLFERTHYYFDYSEIGYIPYMYQSFSVLGGSTVSPEMEAYKEALLADGEIWISVAGGEACRLEPVASSFETSPGYYSAGTSLYILNEAFADAGAVWTITFKVPNYEDKILTQYGDVASATAFSWNNFEDPMAAMNGTSSLRFDANSGARFQWRLSDLNLTPLAIAEFWANLDYLTVDGVRLDKTDDYTGYDALYTTNSGVSIYDKLLGFGPVYGVYGSSYYLNSDRIALGSGSNYPSLEYSEVIFHMLDGNDIVVSEGKPGDNTPPDLNQDNLLIASYNPNYTSNDNRAVWDIMQPAYSNAVYAVTVNGTEYTQRLAAIPSATNPAEGFFTADFGMLAIGINPFAGDYEIVVKARGYVDQTIIIVNEKEEPTVYTVTFDYNDGATGNTTAEVEENATVNKPADPTREGYDFLGWYLDGEAFDFDAAITGDVTLIAKWEKIVVTPTYYTVTFDYNDGVTDSLEVDVEEGTTVTQPEDPAREGYEFLGWYLNDVGFDFTVVITGDVTLVAQWEEITGPDPVFVVSATPSAYVTKLNGNANDLTITVTETLSDGTSNAITMTFRISNNAADYYSVGLYTVYVETKGNDQIRDVYIVQ